MHNGLCMRICQNRCHLMICSCALASLMYIHATTAFHLVFASPRGKVQSSFFYFILTQNILKAERWAKEHGLPFPQIDGNPVLENPDIQECYVFEDQSDPECPTILHFPLTNKTFRDFSAPGKKHYSVTYIYICIYINENLTNIHDFPISKGITHFITQACKLVL